MPRVLSHIAKWTLAAMGYWRAGDLQLLKVLKPYLKTSTGTDWPTVLAVMRRRLAAALANGTGQSLRTS